MSLTQCQSDTNVIENLPDSPTLDTQELKRKFDAGSSGIKDFINTVLLEEIETLVATEKRNLQTMIADEKKNLQTMIANEKKNLNDKINGTVLYNNSSGTSANITFTNNITTYKRLMIEYFDESSKSICISNVPVVLNRLFTLMNFHEGTDNNYLFVAKIKLESNKLVWNSNLRYFLNSGMSETNRKMFISKITGYTY